MDCKYVDLHQRLANVDLYQCPENRKASVE